MRKPAYEAVSSAPVIPAPARPKALIIEDDQQTCRQLDWALRDDFDLAFASDRAMAVTMARRDHPHVIVLDLALPPNPGEPEEGFRFLEDLRLAGGNGKVIVCTGFGERRHALRAIAAGAYDFLTKPVDIDALRLLMQRVAWVSDLEREAARIPPGDSEEMVGTSQAMRPIFAAIRKVAATDVPVLLTGESGTGKELTAKAIHEGSARRDGPFVPINCGAIPESLLEAELFGYEKGAFTGAVQARRGKLEYAHRGTLFLDEIGEMSLPLQVKLLRFLQDRTIERVGGRQTLEVDARILAATNVDLRKAIANGTFREDLYYRLSVVTIAMPPLRERGEDALVIAHVFLKRVSQQMRKPIRGFTPEAVRAIEAYGWPGNVRELSNKIRRAVAMADGPLVTPADLDLPADPQAPLPRPLSLRQARDRVEADLITQSLARHDGNLSRVAEELGISRPTLYTLLRKHSIRWRGSAA